MALESHSADTCESAIWLKIPLSKKDIECSWYMTSISMSDVVAILHSRIVVPVAVGIPVSVLAVSCVAVGVGSAESVESNVARIGGVAGTDGIDRIVAHAPAIHPIDSPYARRINERRPCWANLDIVTPEH